MENCIFCKIIRSEAPSYKIYEDESFVGFLDIYPRNEGHTLLVPKNHYRWVYDVPEFSKYWKAALKITHAIQKALNPTFVAYVTHGLEIEHAHIHIVPRYDDTEFVPPVKNISKEKMQEIADKIRKVL